LRTVLEHQSYLADRRRIERYAEALRLTVRPGAVVLDLGAGTGVLGFLALQAGAARVYSVDEGPVVALVEAIARHNGYESVHALRGRSTRLTLPELVDVVVCDQLAPFGFEAGLFSSLGDAARRHLKPNGELVPGSVTFACAPVAAPSLRQRLDTWLARPGNIDVAPGHEWAVNQSYPWSVEPGDVLAEPWLGPQLDPRIGAVTLRLTGTNVIEAEGTLDAIAGWFMAELAPGVVMTNSPLDVEAINRLPAVLPLREAVPVEPGDEVETSIVVHSSDGAVSWTVTVRRGSEVTRFRQSTLLGVLMRPADLADRRAESRPVLGPYAQARRSLLNWVAEGRDLGQLVAACSEGHEALFPNPEDARTFVLQVLDESRE
jgi:precorrin-6B methylase 2